MNNTRALLCSCVVLILAAPPAARAQRAQTLPAASPSVQSSALDARWSAWLGCWIPSSRRAASSETQLCIVPTADGRGVRRVTFAGDKAVLDETVIADGTPHAVTEATCTGTASSEWAQSGQRLFFSATSTCGAEPQMKSSGVSALVTPDQWLDVQVMTGGGRSEQVRTQRFWRSSDPSPAAVADALGHVVPVRVAVPAVTIADVLEASAKLSSVGVEAWLSESGARVPVDRRALLKLSDAHVDGSVIDLMVALAYPKKFEVSRAASGGPGFWAGGMEDAFYPYPAGWGYLADTYGLGYGTFGVPFFFGAGGYYFEPGGFYATPGVTPSTDATSHGQVVNGQGYTRIQSREPFRGTAVQTGSAQTASSSGGDSGSSGSTSSDSGGASPAGYSGGGGGSTGLTAVPR